MVARERLQALKEDRTRKMQQNQQSRRLTCCPNCIRAAQHKVPRLADNSAKLCVRALGPPPVRACCAQSTDVRNQRMIPTLWGKECVSECV